MKIKLLLVISLLSCSFIFGQLPFKEEKCVLKIDYATNVLTGIYEHDTFEDIVLDPTSGMIIVCYRHIPCEEYIIQSKKKNEDGSIEYKTTEFKGSNKLVFYFTFCKKDQNKYLVTFHCLDPQMVYSFNIDHYSIITGDE